MTSFKLLSQEVGRTISRRRRHPSAHGQARRQARLRTMAGRQSRVGLPISAATADVDEFEGQAGDLPGAWPDAGDSPPLPSQLLRLGNSEFRQGSFDEAIRTFSQAIQQLQSLGQVNGVGGRSGEKHTEERQEGEEEKQQQQQLTPAGVMLLLLLSNRSAAFCRLSKQLRQIPASYSERRARLGLDPLTLAQLALKDADKLVQKGGEGWPKAHYRRGHALMLMEKYDDSRDAFLNGLLIDPANKLLQQGLMEVAEDEQEDDEDGDAGNAGQEDQNGATQEVQQSSRVGPARRRQQQQQQEQAAAAGDGGSPDALRRTSSSGGGSNSGRKRRVERSDEFDCTLCLKLLYAPVTTPCGHSFCRSCLTRTLDHGNKCPMCRTVLFVSPAVHPVSVVLKNILERHFPDEYAERKSEVDAERIVAKETLPLFVMDVVLPRQKMALNIFEPRYRLMVRRIMEGNHRMGMVGVDRMTGTIADLGCEVEILECEPQPDGRFHLEVEGRRRCRLTKIWEQDGYRVANVEWVEDEVEEAPLSPNGTGTTATTAASSGGGSASSSIASSPRSSSGRSSSSTGSGSGSEAPSRTSRTPDLAREAAEVAQKWVDRVLASARGSRRVRLAEYIRSAGEMPPVTQPEQLSFWIANLLPMHSDEKLSLMRMTSSAERLTHELTLLRAESLSTCLMQ